MAAFRDNAFVGEQRGPVPIGTSIGAATFPTDGRTGTELIVAADLALYRVKRDGGNDIAGAPGLGHPAPVDRAVVGRKYSRDRAPSVRPGTGWTRRSRTAILYP